MEAKKPPPLVLALFPGIDLFGRAFEAVGCCVVRGPDTLWGGDIATFEPPAGRFDGVIGGSPCQDFSRARRCPPTGKGVELLAHFGRVVAAASPSWFVLENVPGVPDIEVEGYKVQRFNLDARECGCRQRRLRRFQFGSRDGAPLVLTRSVTPGSSAAACCLATEGERSHRRSWDDFCELQGLPAGFDLPGLSVAAKYRAVGNGVPLAMGRVIAIAILTRAVTPGVRLCVCECGRPVVGNALQAPGSVTPAVTRRRRSIRFRHAGVPVTPGPSRPACLVEVSPAADGHAQHRSCQT